MASKRRLRRVLKKKQCEGKTRYSSELSAQIKARKRKAEQGLMRPYICQFCGHWHLGHTPKWIEEKILDNQGR